MPDRRVHARSTNIEVVRYDRAGKWALEVAHDREPKERVYVSVRTAAGAVKKGPWEVYFGLAGGSTFDRIVRASS